MSTEEETMAEMAARIQSMMPAPEEILRMAQIEAHNDMVQKRREVRLAARRVRQAKKKKKKKKR